MSIASKKNQKNYVFCIYFYKKLIILRVNSVSKRTDMAVETVEIDFKYDKNIIINGLDYKKLTIDEELSIKLNKGVGVYYNIDELNYFKNFDNIVDLVKDVIVETLDLYYKDVKKILVVGLGNDMITPDSLGPTVVNRIEVNSHFEESSKYEVSAICPGVKGCTGLESARIIKSLCNEYNFDLIIVVDALACNHINRMCNSIQVCTAGVSPGAGIGNRTIPFNKETLGTNVLAIGIPTVSDIDCYIDVENNYFVTPNNIDEAMDILSLILSKAINEALLE